MVTEPSCWGIPLRHDPVDRCAKVSRKSVDAPLSPSRDDGSACKESAPPSGGVRLSKHSKRIAFVQSRKRIIVFSLDDGTLLPASAY